MLDFHLPDAINVPLASDFGEAIQQAVPDKSRTVIVYCWDEDCHASPTFQSDLGGTADVPGRMEADRDPADRPSLAEPHPFDLRVAPQTHTQ